MTAYAVTAFASFVIGVLYSQVKSRRRKLRRRLHRNRAIQKRNELFNDRMRFIQEFPSTYVRKTNNANIIFKGNADLMSEDEFRRSLHKDAPKIQVVL